MTGAVSGAAMATAMAGSWAAVSASALALGAGAGMLYSKLSTPNAPGTTAAPAVTPPTPMPQYTTAAAQKKHEQQLSMSSAGQMTPQATLLSGNDKQRNTLGG